MYLLCALPKLCMCMHVNTVPYPSCVYVCVLCASPVVYVYVCKYCAPPQLYVLVCCAVPQ